MDYGKIKTPASMNMQLTKCKKRKIMELEYT